MSSSLRVALVDFDEAVRSGRRMIIDSAKNLTVVYEASGDVVQIQQLASALVDVVVIDQRLATGSGVDYYSRLRQLADSLDELPAAVLTVPYQDPELSFEAYQAGIAAVVSVEQGPASLVEEITRATNLEISLGEIYELIVKIAPKPALDLELREKVASLPNTKTLLIEKLNRDWKKCSQSGESTSLNYLGPLAGVLGCKTVNELVIRLYLNEFINET